MSDYVLSFDPGTKNMAYCLLDSQENIVDWGVFSIASSTYEGRCKNLAKKLDEINLLETYLPKGHKVSVVIEQQMGINTKTNRLCGMLFMYYVKSDLRGIVRKIVHYSAKYKNNFYKWMQGDPLPFKGFIIKKKKPVGKETYFVNEYVAGLGTKYTRTKKTGIAHCERLLIRNKQEQKWIKLFEDNKSKQDDLADAYIQGLSYMKYPSGNKDRNWLKNWDLKKHGLATPAPPKPKKVKKKPKDDEVLNPATGRYVKKTGKIGRNILNQSS